MKRKALLQRITLLATLIIVFVLACNRKFDAPPAYAIPNIQANTTIKVLKTMHTQGNYDLIDSNIIICGIVVADDKSGNIYKQIYLQDSTGGICVSLDGSYLYAQYPVGRQLFIKCKGLWLSDYNNSIQLSAIDNSTPTNLSATGIPSTLFDNYIVKGSLGNAITPKIVTINQLNSAAITANTNPGADTLQGTLVQLNGVQFQSPGYFYADTSSNKNGVSRFIMDCGGTTSMIYTSGYANFAGTLTPAGNGILTAVYVPYKSSSELIIRDTSDVKFTAARCKASVVNVSTIKNYYAGTDITLGTLSTKGIVISNYTNASAGNIIIQDGSNGIDLNFGTQADVSKFNIGDSLVVNVTGGILTNVNGMLQINLSSNAVPATATGKIITPVVVTLSQLSGNISTLENILLQILNTSITSSNSIYSGNATLTDATGNLNLYTYPAASFASSTIPNSCENVVGYINRKSSLQMYIRNTNDVTTASGCVAAKNSFTANYTFANVTTTSGETDPTTVPVITGVSFGSFNETGVSTNPTATGRFSFSKWPVGATNGSDVFTGALSLTQYFEVTITPASGYELDLTSLTMTIQRSGTGVRQWTVRSSVDNFTNNLPASINPANAALQVVSPNIFQIDDAATTAQTGCTITFDNNFTNVTSPVKLRIYGLNAESASGTFSLNGVTIKGNTH